MSLAMPDDYTDEWNQFAKTDLVSGAWRGMPWEDLPEDEQRVFRELLVRWAREWGAIY